MEGFGPLGDPRRASKDVDARSLLSTFDGKSFVSLHMYSHVHHDYVDIQSASLILSC